MKIQHLAIIFIIIMLPISMVLTYYIQTQIDTISLQVMYNSKLRTATYDAIKSFQLNTINNKYSSLSDSKIRDIEASITTFYNSLGTELGTTNISNEMLATYIPSIVYTMYDGYYIYSKYYNETEGEYTYGLKPYIYYSCRYKKGNSDFIVNYSLDNTITIIGIVSGQYVTKSGPLINPNLVSDVKKNANNEVISLKYDGILIEAEILKEQIITMDSSSVLRKEYEYVTYNNKKIYKDNSTYFWNDKGSKQKISDTDTETLNFVNNKTINGHLYSDSAVQYYAKALTFSQWVKSKLSTITQQDAVDVNGNQIKDFAINTKNEKIFDFGDGNNPLLSKSTFNQNRTSVIRKSIESNLSAAIANFGAGANYEFAMPKFTEDDWDKLVNNISVATFMQGIPIGAKYFNDYCIITNDKNKEVVTEDSIYVIGSDNQVHYPGCKDIIDNNKDVIGAYKNIDFERQTLSTDGTERYSYPHYNQKCYNCIVNIAETYDIDEIIKGEVTIYNPSEENLPTKNIKGYKLRKVYLTALARERYDLYKTNNYFGI